MAKKAPRKKKATRKKKALSSSGYEAANGSSKRKASSSVIKFEDEELRERARRSLIGTGQYLYRNFSMVGWAIRKHLDYTTQFQFQARTDIPDLDEQLERLMAEWSLPFNCDASARFNFSQFVRTSEMRRVIDGDVFWVKRRDGKLGAVEADLIRTPGSADKDERWYNGGRINNDGRPLQWGLNRRGSNGHVEFLRRINAKNVIQLCAFDRFDQVRGVSPLAAAFNSFQDCFEGIDYALAKMKVEQLFAMVIHSTGGSGSGDHVRQGDGTYEVDFGKGPVKLEMDADDDAKFLGSDNPGSNTQEFINLVMGMAIKALDLPFNFYDESHTNFFGSRAAWLLYDRSCKAKRSILLEALRRVTVWKMRQWVLDGILVLPDGMNVLDVKYEWVHVGMPWWDPAKEIEGDLMAIAAGLDNPYRICKERGRGEWEDNIRKIKQAQDFAKDQGVTLNFGMTEKPEESEESEEPEESVEEESEEESEEEE